MMECFTGITRIGRKWAEGTLCGAGRSNHLAIQWPSMHKGLFRFLAVLVLALTIPAQGMAAVTAGQCMAFGHHQDGGGSQGHKHAQDGTDGHDHAAHSDPADAEAKQGDDGSKNSHCGPCTACCASASIAGPTGLSVPSSPSNAKYVVSQLPPLGVQPHGLDRPPLAL
jgi:hypothetical protein